MWSERKGSRIKKSGVRDRVEWGEKLVLKCEEERVRDKENSG